MEFFFSERKNATLKKERGVSFDEVIAHIENGDLLAVLLHPNQDKHPGQQIYVVRMREYIYVVPFEIKDEKCYLRTIYPSRQLAKQFLKEEL